MVSNYNKGLQVGAPTPAAVQPREGQLGAKLLVIGGGLLALFVMSKAKSKPARVGADVSDIEAKIRARGLDPRKYF